MFFTSCSNLDVSDFCTSIYCSRFSEGSIVLVGRIEFRKSPSPGVPGRGGGGGTKDGAWLRIIGIPEVSGDGRGNEVGVGGRL